jgi:2,3-bisphosphoglycerate-dependent phosphoglycerate mutase
MRSSASTFRPVLRFYEFDDNFNVVKHYYLGMSEEELKAKMDAVAKQGAAKK